MTVTIDGTNGITTPGETNTANASISGTLSVTGTSTLTGTATLNSAQVTLIAGTTSLAPLKFQSGTSLTSATAGAIEYDGKVLYSTPQGAQRGVIPGAQLYRLDSTLAGANSGAVQNALGVSVTLSSSTVYAFEALYIMTKTAGTSSHTVDLLLGGTATINNVLYGGNSALITSSTPVGADTSGTSFLTNVATASTSTALTTTAAVSRMISFKGMISVNAGGTLTPQYQLSNAPGGAYTMRIGSYFLIYPIGASGANTSVGTWA